MGLAGGRACRRRPVPGARARSGPHVSALTAVAEAHFARRAGSLSRGRAGGSVARRSRQSPPRRLASACPSACVARRERSVGRPHREALRHVEDPARACRVQEAFGGTYEPLDLGNGVCAFVRGGAVLVAAAVQPDAVPGSPAGWRDVLGVEGLLLALRDRPRNR